jgi:hypothetical protein
MLCLDVHSAKKAADHEQQATEMTVANTYA